MKKKYEGFEKASLVSASRWIKFAFAMAFGQLGGMGYLIFVQYSWEVMEPVTYMVQAFYATVGTLFYVLSKKDFEFSSGHSYFKDRKLEKLIKKNNFDKHKIAFLEEYTKTLREQLAILENTGPIQEQTA